jgi:hypothetical protein
VVNGEVLLEKSEHTGSHASAFCFALTRALDTAAVCPDSDDPAYPADSPEATVPSRFIGNGASLGRADFLYFTVGPNEETDGVFGSLNRIAPPNHDLVLRPSAD